MPDLLRLPKGVNLFLDACIPGLKGRGRRLGDTLAGVLVLFHAAGTTTIATGAVDGELRLVSLPDTARHHYSAFMAQLKLKELVQYAESFPVCP